VVALVVSRQMASWVRRTGADRVATPVLMGSAGPWQRVVVRARYTRRQVIARQPDPVAVQVAQTATTTVLMVVPTVVVALVVAATSITVVPVLKASSSLRIH